MRSGIAIIYNEPAPSRYAAMGEGKAIAGVLEEVAAVHQALIELGYAAVRVPLSPPLTLVRQQLASLKEGIVFNLFEGFDGRPQTESEVAAIIAALGKSYTGCPPGTLSLALDKGKANALLRQNGITTPRSQLLSPQTLDTFSLGYPCIVKPRSEDASHGISEESVISDFISLKRQVSRVHRLFGGEALVEEYIDGREFNATVLGGSEAVVLPFSEIVYSLPPGMPRILTFAAKWEPDSLYYRSSTVVCPAEVDEQTGSRIRQIAQRSFQVMGCAGYARVDLRLDSHGVPNVIEVNPNPDISPGAGAARQAQAAGMSYPEFVEKIVQLALQRETK